MSYDENDWIFEEARRLPDAEIVRLIVRLAACVEPHVVPLDARCPCGKPAHDRSPWGNWECTSCKWERLNG